VEWLASTIEAVGGAVGGGRIAGILLMAFGVRAVLIPLMLPMAVRTRARQKVMRKIRPRIKELDRELRDDPSELSRQLKALHNEHGIEVVDWPGLIGALIQLPVLIALFQAVLIVWEPESMTATGLGIGVIAGIVSMIGMRMSGQADGRAMLVVSLVLPIAIAIWLGTGIALYLVGFYAASVIQGFMMPKEAETADGAVP
jgi:membrane protein insertase Oxa1/YidC/SpoIIIJ